MKNKLFFIVSFALLWCDILYAQHKEYQFSHLNIKNGLSHNRVLSIYKDSKGFMWFGTLTGLNRYDGYKFKVFKHDAADTNSLRNNIINHITEGPENKLWITTLSGFDIYDPRKERFDHNAVSFLQSKNIPGNFVTSLKKGKDGRFWFLHSSLGLYCYNPVSNVTIHLSHNPIDTTTLYSNALIDMSEDSKGNIWVTNSLGIIEKIDVKINKVIYRNYSLYNRYPYSKPKCNIYIDNQDDLWLFDFVDPIGLVYINVDKNIYITFNERNNLNRLNTNNLFSVVQDDNGFLWVGTDHGGVNLIDKNNNFKIQYITSFDDEDKDLAQNSVLALYKDNTGIVWMGTYKKGAFYYDQRIIKFPSYKHLVKDSNSLSFNDINCFSEDRDGNIWIGTNGGGLIHFYPKENSFITYKHDPKNNNSINNDVIVKMFVDHDQKLWIGTFYGGLDCFDGTIFKHYLHDFSNPNSISDDRIWSIQEDAANNVWIGTLQGGLNILAKDRKTFSHPSFGLTNPIYLKYVPFILKDAQGNMWLSTIHGIFIWEQSNGQLVHLSHQENNPQTIIQNDVVGLMQDSRGWVWVTTHEGLSILDQKFRIIATLQKKDGLSDNNILDIQEDDKHNMWVSSSNGLSNLLVTSRRGGYSFKFVNYDETDGLQGRDFTEHASAKLKNGKLVFGGPAGFNMFNPADIKFYGIKTIPVFTDFQLFNTSLFANEKTDGHVILDNAITETKDITLIYNENVFSVEFAALNYFDQDKIKYRYKLEGFDKNWITTDYKTHKASYTNLDPGSYILRVKASDIYGFGNENQLKITILPPIWRTTLAYILYACAIIGVLLFIRRRGIQKLKAQFAIEQERQEVMRIHELDMMKIKFFTNVSHEFRTPLSLIMAPVDKILKRITDPEIQSQLVMINKNARRMLNLVNQLLDFRKMEVQELKLQARDGEIISFIKDIYYSFTDVASKKNINYTFDSTVSRLDTNFDHDKIERIMFNLLSNSFKFTTSGSVNVELSDSFNSELEQHYLKIEITDTGIGIPKDKQDRIFDRFFQNEVPGSFVNQGSGIGLSITKEFVKLHQGDIWVHSELNKGSCFTLTLPLNVNYIHGNESLPAKTIVDSATANSFENVLPVIRVPVNDKKNTILMVEDNDDFRFYIKDNLKDHYNIVEAVNGKEGWKKALIYHPDLIVTDISMPEMNGIELCKKLKNDSRTAHIPVVLLTAIGDEEKQLEGFDTGATDYIIKPFNFEILLSKIRTFLAQQESMRKTYKKQVQVKTTEINVTSSADEKFILKALQYVEKNIADTELSVEDLSSEMCLSRGSLYKKLLVLTGKTPSEFIRHIRIERAAQLLKNSTFNISEVAYQVGFNNPKYFAKYFKDEYGVLPSNYTDKKHQETA